MQSVVYCQQVECYLHFKGKGPHQISGTLSSFRCKFAGCKAVVQPRDLTSREHHLFTAASRQTLLTNGVDQRSGRSIQSSAATCTASAPGGSALQTFSKAVSPLAEYAAIDGQEDLELPPGTEPAWLGRAALARQGIEEEREITHPFSAKAFYVGEPLLPAASMTATPIC